MRIVGDLTLGQQIVAAPGEGLIFKPTIPAEELARPTIADHLGPNEVILAVDAPSFPETGKSLERAKILDQTTLAIHNLELDADTGEVTSFSEARAAEEEAWRAAHGALSRRLAESLDERPSDELVSAYVWADVPAKSPLLAQADTASEWDAAHSAYLTRVEEQNRPAVESLESALEAAGAEVVKADLHPARIKIRTTRAALEETIAFLPGAALVAEVGTPVLTGIKASDDLVEDPLFPAHLDGLGQGLRIAIVEPNACINTRHVYFRDVTFEDTEPFGSRCDDNQDFADAHSTAVAGAAARVKGFDPDLEYAGLFAGRMFDAEEGTMAQGILDRNPHLINMSFLTSDGDGPAIDSAVFLDRVFVANGAGNLDAVCHPSESGGPCAPDDDLRARCSSYNAVCVGGYDHRETTGPGNFGDDIIYSNGLWLNDPATGREAPQLVGPAFQHLPISTAASGESPYSGTSFASPAVLGLAGLIEANFLPYFLGDPTLMRAVLFASASHPVHDYDGDDTPIALFSDGVDDKSGMGVPRGDRALHILQNRHFFTGFLDRAEDFNQDSDLTEDLSIDVHYGDVVRVALAWDQCPDVQAATPALSTDLDLLVVGPGAMPEQIKANTSLVDNYEAVHFIASDDGPYVIHVHASRWDACRVGFKTFVAVAWDAQPLLPMP